MSPRNQPPQSRLGLSDRPDELQAAIAEIESLESDRPSVEVNITGPHPGIVNSAGQIEPKRSLIPKALDTPLKRIAACIAALLVAAVSTLVAKIIEQITSK